MKLSTAWLTACLLLLLTGGGWSEVREGTFLDIRYDDLLLGGTEGGLNLRMVENSKILLNGESATAKELTPGKPAFADYDPATGWVRRLEVIDPSTWRTGDKVFQLTVGQRFGENPEGAFRAGDILRFQVRAAPDQDIYCSIAGFGGRRPAQELRPGLYRCSLPVPKNLDLRHAYAYAGNGEEIVFGPRFQLAPTAPIILESGDFEGSLFVRFHSPGSWLRKANLWVDGQLINGLQAGSDTVLSPPLELPSGSHKARWRLLDQAGNESLYDFTFRRD